MQIDVVNSAKMFFFFKQKTAYEMRISDWSSDVCSSDLLERRSDADIMRGDGRRDPARRSGAQLVADPPGKALPRRRIPQHLCRCRGQWAVLRRKGRYRPAPQGRPCREWRRRSEEQTSELQSLMRISYAVFCLKKK